MKKEKGDLQGRWQTRRILSSPHTMGIIRYIHINVYNPENDPKPSRRDSSQPNVEKRVGRAET